MAKARKTHDVVLPEVRKPAGYGTLVAVIKLDEDTRELWFQHPEPPGILRCVEVDMSTGEADKPVTFKTKGERDRD